MNVTEIFEQMEQTMELAKADVAKFDNGNATAGTRVRKYMQELKNLAQEMRVTVQEVKNAEK